MALLLACPIFCNRIITLHSIGRICRTVLAICIVLTILHVIPFHGRCQVRMLEGPHQASAALAVTMLQHLAYHQVLVSAIKALADQ